MSRPLVKGPVCPVCDTTTGMAKDGWAECRECGFLLSSKTIAMIAAVPRPEHRPARDLGEAKPAFLPCGCSARKAALGLCDDLADPFVGGAR